MAETTPAAPPPQRSTRTMTPLKTPEALRAEYDALAAHSAAADKAGNAGEVAATKPRKIAAFLAWKASLVPGEQKEKEQARRRTP